MKELLTQEEIDILLKDLGSHDAVPDSKKTNSRKKKRRKAFAHSLDILLERYTKGENYYNKPAFVLWAVEYSDLADCPGCEKEIDLRKLNCGRCPLCGQMLDIEYYFT